MSRIGKHPVPVPDGVTVNVAGQEVAAKGKLGELKVVLVDEVEVALADGAITVAPRDDRKRTRTMWGMSRTLVSNIVVELTNNSDEFQVYSLVTLHRNMNEDDEHTMVGHREDLLRRVNGVLKLARRKVILDQNILLNKKLNTFL